VSRWRPLPIRAGTTVNGTTSYELVPLKRPRCPCGRVATVTLCRVHRARPGGVRIDTELGHYCRGCGEREMDKRSPWGGF
jgi:hypothetical protein